MTGFVPVEADLDDLGADEPRVAAFSAQLTGLARPVSFAGDNTVTMADPRSVLLVTRGDLDLFAVDLGQVLQSEALLRGRQAAGAAGGSSGRWTFVCRVSAGTLLIGAPSGPNLTLLGRPLPGTTVDRLPLAAVAELVAPVPDAGPGDGVWHPPVAPVLPAVAAEVVEALDAGLMTLSLALRSELPPRDFVALDAGSSVTATAGSAVRIVQRHGWVVVQSGSVSFGADTGLSPIGPGEAAFLTDADWMTVDSEAELRFTTTSELLAYGRLWPMLSAHGGRLLQALQRRIKRREAAETAQLARRVEQDEQVVGRAQQSLGAVLSGSKVLASLEQVTGDPPALAAMRLVCSRLGIPVVAPSTPPGVGVLVDPVQAVARASQLRTRTVWLAGGWWKRDIGPLVGYRVRDDSPVALLPAGRHDYEVVDPADGSVVRVARAGSSMLTTEATMIYRPLPSGDRRGRDLVRLGLAGCRRELAAFLWCGLFLAVLGLFVPIVAGLVLGQFVPRGQRSLIVDACLVLVASGVLAAVFGSVQNLVVLRIEGKLSATLQAAIWDHLLALPVTFFANYSVGELSLAAMAVNAVRDAVSGVATTTALALLVGGANLILLFVVSLPMALIAVAMVVVSLAVCAIAGRYEIRQQRALFALQQRLSAKVFQLLNGLPKLRVASAEDRGYANWAADFTQNRRIAVRTRQTQNFVNVFNAGFALICSLTIFAVAATWTHLSTTAFLAFFSAYSLLLGATLQFTSVVISVLGVVPLLESLRPITGAAREVSSEKADPGELSGALALNAVSFQYAPDGPRIIDDISLSVRAGEFVALVGPTGCGKSTLVRLLLGFAHPTAGSVLYDGRDLSGLDVTAVRRQCGVVLQNGSLLAGDVKTNIVGNGLYTEDDAWDAATLAGLAEDIREMPMGMFTMVSEGASTLSGGQRQRLMIARALVSKPRILILDEATSALDNPTQARVADSTRQLHATRIVIAHRLSTVRYADRIVVMDGGRVVQQGSYDELVADEDGLFARLVRRQIA